jgi:hypothetical protein
VSADASPQAVSSRRIPQPSAQQMHPSSRQQQTSVKSSAADAAKSSADASSCHQQQVPLQDVSSRRIASVVSSRRIRQRPSAPGTPSGRQQMPPPLRRQRAFPADSPGNRDRLADILSASHHPKPRSSNSARGHRWVQPTMAASGPHNYDGQRRPVG